MKGVIGRAMNENVPIIIEGVHLIPGKLHDDTEFYEQCKGRLVEYTIGIKDPELHRNRFKKRQAEAPERNLQKYISNFNEIRIIHDYLCERSDRFDGIKFIDNTNSIEEGLNTILSYYNSK